MPRFLPLLGFLLLGGSVARAQVAVRAPGGTLTGLVQDSATGRPVGYALVVLVERDQRVFAGESGRFTLTGLGGGAATLRIQQIGYRAITISLTLDARSPVAPGAPGLVVRLARQVFVLPELVVRGDICDGGTPMGEEGTILDEAFKNADRLLTLEREYPFRGSFQRVTTLLDSEYVRTGGWVDTINYDSRELRGYHRGEVLVRRPRGGADDANYFAVSDVAREEFRKSHCFWYAGRDSVEGFPGYRIDFAPTARTKSVDWAGSLLIDSVSMTLLRSEAHLVNLTNNATSFRSALCTVFYKQLAPTLAHEFQARCVISQGSKPPQIVVQRWLLTDFGFIHRTPTGPDPPT
jgi:hypothetical protein